MRLGSATAVVLALSLALGGRATAGPERPAAADGEPAVRATAPARHGASRGPVKPEAQASTGSPFVFVPTIPPGSLAGAGGNRPEPSTPGRRLTLEKGGTPKPDANIDRAPLPGTFRPETAAVPSPFARTQIIDQRSKPDLEVGVSDRTTLGVFSEASAIERTDIRNSTVRETRDLGAGVTLQYKFGQ